MPVGSLPMYWRDETGAAWRRFWAQLQHHVPLPDIVAPEALPPDWTKHWCDPELALSMTCGLPLRSSLKGRVRYVATLDFGIEGAPAGYYRSVVVMRRSDSPKDGLRLAYNSSDSQSGWAAAESFRAEAQISWLQTLVSGGHRSSARAVAEGTADLACIDAVTWRLITAHDPWAQALHVVAQTEPTPGLPCIAHLHSDPVPLCAALKAACAQTSAQDKTRMGGLRGVVVLPLADYLAQPIPAAPK